MELIPIIEGSLKLFAGLFVLVLSFSYLLYKVSHKNKDEMQAAPRANIQPKAPVRQVVPVYVTPPAPIKQYAEPRVYEPRSVEAPRPQRRHESEKAVVNKQRFVVLNNLATTETTYDTRMDPSYNRAVIDFR